VPFLNRAIDLQFEHWLPDDILTKQDKVSMAHGLEVRVPFLDHELVEYALAIPPRLKIRRFASKWLLRRYAQRLLPRSVTSRRKMPFYVPVERYLEQPSFRELVDEALTPRAVRERGIFRPEALERLRAVVAGGEFIHAKQLLSVVILELWFRAMVDRRGLR
jgi:asparagine synthase (glutamine-hydrolysing)